MFWIATSVQKRIYAVRSLAKSLRMGLHVVLRSVYYRCVNVMASLGAEEGIFLTSTAAYVRNLGVAFDIVVSLLASAVISELNRVASARTHTGKELKYLLSALT